MLARCLANSDQCQRKGPVSVSPNTALPVGKDGPGSRKGNVTMKTARDVLAVLGLVLVGWVLLAMAEAAHLVH